MAYDFSLTHQQAAENTKNKVKIKKMINFDGDNRDIGVSVIVPICNVEHYIKQCLNSIIKQTLRNIEIICVNDGSKDNSESIIESYAKRDKRVKIIDKENAGYGHTMNIGMDMAKGKYIAIIESDDYVELNMLQYLYETAEKNNVDIVKSDYYTFKTNNKKVVQEYEKTCLDKLEYYNKILSPVKNKNIFYFQMNTWTGIYRRDFLIENNIRHNETPGASYQDNGFWFQTLSQANSIMFVDKAFYHYRQDNPNSSINSSGKVFCMNEEYDFIFSFILANPTIKKEFILQYFHKRFYNYMHTYSRIADEFKLPFLKRFSEELNYMQTQKIINLYDLQNEWMSKMCLRILDDYKCFYYEDTIYRLEKNLNDANHRLSTLRDSKELKTGLKIKKMLGK